MELEVDILSYVQSEQSLTRIKFPVLVIDIDANFI